MEQKTAHLRIKPRRIMPEGDGGTIFWATPTRARQLLDLGAVDLLNAPGPAETKPAGPDETKESLEKKSFATDPAGPLTDSVASSDAGSVAVSSASAAAPASPKRKSRKSAPPTPPAGE